MFKRIFKILLFLLLLPYLLVLLYIFVNPISLPIIGQLVTYGSIEWDWVDYDEVSPALPRMIIAAEDANFCIHNGVDWEAVDKVVEDAKRKGKLSRGASTISMQVSKNLFLWPLPTFARKPLEVPLAMWIDLTWGKRRVIEVYMNIAEMGDGVYGAEAASQKFFGKSVNKLISHEAALIAASLPNPKQRNVGKPSAYHYKYAASIQRRAGSKLVSCIK